MRKCEENGAVAHVNQVTAKPPGSDRKILEMLSQKSEILFQRALLRFILNIETHAISSWIEYVQEKSIVGDKVGKPMPHTIYYF